MIAKLSGILDSAGSDGVVVDVGGVGYLVFCSARTLRQLPGKGEAVRLVVETHVREDHIHLYGFIDEAERSAYRLLTTVQGVGAKVGLGVQVTVASGLAVLGVGIVLLAVPQQPSDDSETFAMSPTLLPGGAGLTVAGRF